VQEPGQICQVEAGERVLVFALQASVLTARAQEVAPAAWAGEAVAA